MQPNFASTLAILRQTRQRRQQKERRAMLQLLLAWTAGGALAIGTLWAVLMLGGINLLAQLYTYYTAQLPSTAQIEQAFSTTNSDFFQTTKIYDRTGQYLLYEVLDPQAGDRQWLNLGDIPSDLINATIAIEDQTFYQNSGYDLSGIGRALWSNLQGNPVQGGSTITQQLVKNVLISPNTLAEQTYERKIRELLLAVEVTNRYTKNDILQWYLNTNFYGNLAYGIDAAARVYFNKSARELDLAESALLAAIPQYPALNPIDAPQAAKQRQELVLDLMQTQGYIDAAAASATKQVDVLARLHPSTERFNIIAPHFSQYVLQQLLQQLDPQLVYRGGLNVYTTLDLDLQFQTECVARTQLLHLSGAELTTQVAPANRGECLAAQQLPPLRSSEIGFDHRVSNTAALVLDSRNGQILAMLGSKDYWDKSIDGSFNVAVDGLRQPGSAFKTFSYITAFSQGYTPATMILDVRKAFDSGSNTPYVPENYDRQFHGAVSLREALARSYNIPAVEVLNWVGVNNVLRIAHQLGINSLESGEQYGLALGLGGGEVTLLDLTYAYSVLSNNGRMVGQLRDNAQLRPGYRTLDPVAILRITDSTGQPLQACGVSHNAVCDFSQSTSQQVLSPELAYLITDVLADQQARIAAFGSPNPLEIDRPAAVKTGTTNSYIDNWTIGYTPQLTVGVWVGNSDSTPMEKVSGITGAAPLWHAIMRYASRNSPPIGWEQPPNIVRRQVCYPSGLLVTSTCQKVVSDIFVKGTEPNRPDNVWRVFQVNRESGKLATIYTPPDLIENRVYLSLPVEANDWLAASSIPQPPKEYDTVNVPTANNQVAAIQQPPPFAYVRGIVDIQGSTGADPTLFESAKIQIGLGLNPSEWTQISPTFTEPIPTVQSLAQWNTIGLSGLYSLQLLVLQPDQQLQQHTVQVTVDNQAPSVQLQSPLDGQSFSIEQDESVVIQPNASDNLLLTKVQLFVNGNYNQQSSSAPFPMRWQPKEPGTYNLFVVAQDGAGNTARSETVKITIGQ